MRPRPVFEPYADAFHVACHFPIGLKAGDGSTMPCLQSSRWRVLFPSGGRCMVCPAHKEVMEGQWGGSAASPAPGAET